jgi:NadR type nicotinamide-nucleotide adenylyltransferase
VQKKIRIAVTGPESTGKSTLAKQLAESYNGVFIPEYARQYIGNLPGHYTYNDVEKIAAEQVHQYIDTVNSNEAGFSFFDTWLIITKVWFMWVYSKTPDWLEERIQTCPIDLFLLCRPDLPWEEDPVRENGGDNRIKLFELYKAELEHYGFSFVEIGGLENERLDNSIRSINEFFESPETFRNLSLKSTLNT